MDDQTAFGLAATINADLQALLAVVDEISAICRYPKDVRIEFERRRVLELENQMRDLEDLDPAMAAHLQAQLDRCRESLRQRQGDLENGDGA